MLKEAEQREDSRKRGSFKVQDTRASPPVLGNNTRPHLHLKLVHTAPKQTYDLPCHLLAAPNQSGDYIVSYRTDIPE